MSRAFVKENAEAAPPPERMVSDGPNPVTERGMAQIEDHVARIESGLRTETNELLRETLARDLRYWQVARSRAEVVKPAAGGRVAFGSCVTLRRTGREQRLRIVGEDEANPGAGLISWRSPVAHAILGAEEGDVVEMQKPPAEILIVKVEN
jgi:transcription elongation GreA/GreB family factor